jgi:hypothetical protein
MESEVDEMKNYMQIALLRNVTCRIRAENKYEYNPNGKAKWLQKICFKILSKLNCNAIDEQETVKIANFTHDSLSELIGKQLSEVYDMNIMPKRVYVGHDEFMQLSGEQIFAQQMVNFEPEDPKFMGVKITVLPYMKGVLVV